jgi:hypothetical protein
MAVIAPKARADPAQSPEYQVKAAFLYNFIKFVDWPEEKLADSNEPIVIGIIGKNPFGDAFEAIKDKSVKDRKVVITYLKGLDELKKSGQTDDAKLHPQIEAIRKCHLLFICQSEKENLKETMNLVKGYSILTVGDTQGFLESGGIVNFVVEANKVRFEIGISAAKRAKLQIRSQLLRLAKEVVEEK